MLYSVFTDVQMAAGQFMSAVRNVAAKIDGAGFKKAFSSCQRCKACEGITCAEV